MIIIPKRLDWKMHIDVPSSIKDADFTPKSLRSNPKINFVVSTCERSPEYIHKMMATMYMGGFPADHNISLVVSGTKTDYLDCYKHLPNIRIYKYNDDEWEKIKILPMKFRASYNYIQCLSISENENSLIFEDDIIFQNNWLSKMYKCISSIESEGNEKYILSLFCPNKHQTTKSFAKMPRVTWAGTQAVFYPKLALDVIRPFVKSITDSVSRIQSEPSNPLYLNAYDMLVKECCILEEIDIMTPCESLVQHIGNQTVGGTGQNIMISPIFHSKLRID